ncbi:MAG: NAD(P)-dependent oxidoreductase [Vicinamibacterales bacterium]
MRVLVVGSRGQLGAAVAHVFRRRHEVSALDRAALDITDAAAVRDTVGRLRPDVVINCVAWNAVDRAEDCPAEALRVNALAVRGLVRALGPATLVHFSTDFVFDGTAERPYVETDAPNPICVYAMSKLLGEWFAADAPRSYVLRVESLFGRAPDGAAAKGSVETIVAALERRDRPRVFEDRVVTPTSVMDCAEATLALLETGAPFGLYHCVNPGAATWLDLAREAARILGVPAEVEAVRFADVKFPAPRPKFCALDTSKLAAAGVPMRPWQDALGAYLRERPAAGSRDARARGSA